MLRVNYTRILSSRFCRRKRESSLKPNFAPVSIRLNPGIPTAVVDAETVQF